MRLEQAAKSFAIVSLVTVLAFGANRLEAQEDYPHQLTSADGGTTTNAKFLGYRSGRFQLQFEGGKVWKGELSHFNESSQNLLRKLAGLTHEGLSWVAETWSPCDIEVISRGQESGKVVEVEDIGPKHNNVPVSHIKVDGKWHSLDGPGGLNADQRTLDAIEAARKHPVGDVRVYGYNLGLEKPDASAFDGVKCRAVKCTEWDVYGIREDGVLISTREQPTRPDGEPIQNVHWIDRFAHDTLIIKTAGGMVYKIVGDSTRAEMIGSGPMDFVRKDQVALFGTYVTNTRRVERPPEPRSDDDGPVVDHLRRTGPPRGGQWSEIYYVPIGHVSVGRDGRVQVVEDASASSGLAVTIDTSAIAVEDKNVVCVGSNKLGEIVVVSMSSGMTQVTTYSPRIQTSHALDQSLSGAEIVYEKSNASAKFAEQAKAVGFNHLQINNIAGNGDQEIFLASRNAGFMRLSSRYNTPEILGQKIAYMDRYSFASPHALEFCRGGMVGLDSNGEMFSPGGSVGNLKPRSGLSQEMVSALQAGYYSQTRHVKNSGGFITGSKMVNFVSDFSYVDQGYHAVLEANILRPAKEGDAVAPVNEGDRQIHLPD